MLKEVSFRSADSRDAPLIARFLRELAQYERKDAETDIDEVRLAQHLAPNAAPQLYVIVAECDGIPVGMASYYMRYSTFSTAWGLHLEDLYVIEPHRSRGLGRAFFVILARIAAKHGYTRLDFNVLDWNPAQELYKRLGATVLDDWIAMRLEGDVLRSLATNPERHEIHLKQQ